MYRLLLAALIALAVGIGPVGAAVAGSSALSKPPVEDCHGKASKDPSCCDTKGSCPDPYGVKCCKVVGVTVASAPVHAFAFATPEAVAVQKPPDWQLRPRPPPPRS